MRCQNFDDFDGLLTITPWSLDNSVLNPIEGLA